MLFYVIYSTSLKHITWFILEEAIVEKYTFLKKDYKNVTFEKEIDQMLPCHLENDPSLPRFKENPPLNCLMNKFESQI